MMLTSWRRWWWWRRKEKVNSLPLSTISELILLKTTVLLKKGKTNLLRMKWSILNLITIKRPNLYNHYNEKGKKQHLVNIALCISILCEGIWMGYNCKIFLRSIEAISFLVSKLRIIGAKVHNGISFTNGTHI